MNHTQHGTFECNITAKKIVSLAVCSLIFFAVAVIFPVSDTAVGRILSYAIGTFGGLGLIVVLCALHLKYVRRTPWAVVTKNALKWFVPTKMDYASLDFAGVERFYAVDSLGHVTVFALLRDGSKVRTGVNTAFVSKKDVEELLRVAASRLGEFNSAE